jgi:ABC-type dipeptide/oligopeptide/nickel transport system permease subunit
MSRLPRLKHPDDFPEPRTFLGFVLMNFVEVTDWYVRGVMRLPARLRFAVMVGCVLFVGAIFGLVTILSSITSPSNDVSKEPERVTAKLDQASSDLRRISETISEGEASIGAMTKTVDDLKTQATSLQTFLQENPQERDLLNRLASGGRRSIWIDVAFVAASALLGAVVGAILDRFLTNVFPLQRERRDEERT